MDRHMYRRVIIAFSFVLSMLAPLSAWGEILAQRCAQAIQGDVSGSSITNICGVSEETIKALVELFRDEKLALQTIADERKQAIADLRRLLDLNDAQIRTALEILGEKNVPQEKLASTLVAIATQFNDRLKSISAPQTDDSPEIAALRTKVRDRINEGQLGAAEALINQILERQIALRTDAQKIIASQEERTRSIGRDISESYRQRGDIASTQLRFKDAAMLFAQAASQDGILEEQRTELQALEAFSWLDAGEMSNTANALETAVERFEAISQRIKKEDVIARASADQNLAVALFKLGSRRADNAFITRSVKLLRTTMEILGKSGDFSSLALVKTNLSSALVLLGERLHDEELLREAVELNRQALLTVVKEPTSTQLVTVLNNLAVALHAVGTSKHEAASLREAVDHYDQALTNYPRGLRPLDWASTQNNKANALLELFRIGGDEKILGDAQEAFQRALEEATADRAPLLRADIQNDYGLSHIERLNGGLEDAEKAISLFEAALVVRTRATVPVKWASTQGNMGAALAATGVLKADPEIVRRGLTAIRSALDVIDKEAEPLKWALLKQQLAGALVNLDGLATEPKFLNEAEDALNDAMPILGGPMDDIAHIRYTSDIGLVKYLLAKRDKSAEKAQMAVIFFNIVVSNLPEQLMIMFPDALYGLASSLQLYGELARDPSYLVSAASNYEFLLKYEQVLPSYYILFLVKGQLADTVFKLSKYRDGIKNLERSQVLYRDLLLHSEDGLNPYSQGELTAKLDATNAALAKLKSSKRKKPLGKSKPRRNRG